MSDESSINRKARIEYFNGPKGEGHWPPGYFWHSKPGWMNSNQWAQAVAFATGQTIPTNPELVSGLRGEGSFHDDDRCHRWVWSSWPAIMVAEGYDEWCDLICGKYDPNLAMDEGL